MDFPLSSSGYEDPVPVPLSFDQSALTILASLSDHVMDRDPVRCCTHCLQLLCDATGRLGFRSVERNCDAGGKPLRQIVLELLQARVIDVGVETSHVHAFRESLSIHREKHVIRHSFEPVFGRQECGAVTWFAA